MAETERRAALFPVIGSTASVTARDLDLTTVTPIGSFASGERTSRTIGFQVVQPILDPTRLFYTAPAARAVNHPGEEEPGAHPDMLSRPLPDVEEAVERALKSRPDLKALKAHAEALDKRRGSGPRRFRVWTPRPISSTWTDRPTRRTTGPRGVSPSPGRPSPPGFAPLAPRR